ncbi:proton-coupled amino acid transporter-like protein CG1139, partial [Neodiprion virginianus]|uniref:Proton-coupled amino acid transporter-like protein CG1139 n=3 Tax=Neodiprion TaxID=270857 RepID=A0A6J0BKY5_NEOLC
MHLFKSTIGSGLLFLPRAFKETGTISGAACSILTGFVTMYTAITTVRCAQILCKRVRVPSLDLGEVASSSFEYGPEFLRKYGRTFKAVTNVMACFAEYQTVIIYILYVATSFQQVIEYFSTIVWDVRIYILLSAPFYCLVSLVPNLQYLTPMSVVGSLFLIAGFFVTLYYFFKDMKSP